MLATVNFLIVELLVLSDFVNIIATAIIASLVFFVLCSTPRWEAPGRRRHRRHRRDRHPRRLVHGNFDSNLELLAL